MNEGEKEKVPNEAILFTFGFIFLYVSMSYFGAPMELAAIASATVIIGAFVVFNQDMIKKAFKLYKKPKEPEPKVIDAEIVQEEVN